ncbi:MAG TPA: quinolinate synthase [Clostridiales bacterium]|nr:quinolinate synthase [Clostridiales bacterium]
MLNDNLPIFNQDPNAIARLREEILLLKAERDAIIVAHNYQRDEVQAIADLVGDSFALARHCSTATASTIVFCGVHFMAESAKILAPDKTVLLPERDAGCPMADMVDEQALLDWRRVHPGVAVVCYINSSAAVKAASDICCTSSNAVAVVRSLTEKEVLFVPDCNLGQYVALQVPEKKIHLWEGYCITHHQVRSGEVAAARQAHPGALLLAHPETRPEIWQQADFVGSTKQIIDYARQSPAAEFLIGTEMGVFWQLRRNNPEKTFYLLSPGLICPNMKKTSLTSVRDALAKNQYQIETTPEVSAGAKAALTRMLAIS